MTIHLKSEVTEVFASVCRIFLVTVSTLANSWEEKAVPTKLDTAALGSRVSDIPQPHDKLAKETKMQRVKKLSLNL